MNASSCIEVYSFKIIPNVNDSSFLCDEWIGIRLIAFFYTRATTVSRAIARGLLMEVPSETPADWSSNLNSAVQFWVCRSIFVVTSPVVQDPGRHGGILFAAAVP